jgi:hypothetical protein
MATKRIPRPRDPIALAKLIGDIATGQVGDTVEDGKDEHYGEPVGATGRYSPGECVGIEQRRVEGRPDPSHVSTSYVERSFDPYG